MFFIEVGTIKYAPPPFFLLSTVVPLFEVIFFNKNFVTRCTIRVLQLLTLWEAITQQRDKASRLLRKRTKTNCLLESKWSFTTIFIGNVQATMFGFQTVSDCRVACAQLCFWVIIWLSQSYIFHKSYELRVTIFYLNGDGFSVCTYFLHTVFILGYPGLMYFVKTH